MNALRAVPSSPADVASEFNDLLAGVGILTMALFPLAVPVLVLVLAPLALVAVAGLLLTGILVLPLWLARIVLRRRSGHPIAPRWPRRRRACPN